MMSALDEARRLLPRPDFVLYAGDYLVHGFEAKFEAYDGGGPDAFARFVIKTMTFVSQQLQATFPETPVYGTLGNDDAICGNYRVAPGGRFLAAVGELWATQSAHPDAFQDFCGRRLLRGAAPDGPGPRSDRAEHRALVDGLREPVQPGRRRSGRCPARLARVDALPHEAARPYRLAPVPHPAGHRRLQLLTWLRHLPRRRHAVPQGSLRAPFLALLEQYRDILQDSYAGHTHMDDFRVVPTAAGEPILLTHITPAISPIYQNNPASAWCSTTARAAISSTTRPSISPTWRRPGRARRRGGRSNTRSATPMATPPTTRRPRRARAVDRDDAAVRDDYVTFYPVRTASSDPPIDQQNWKAYACAQTEFTAEAFAACYCGD